MMDPSTGQMMYMMPQQMDPSMMGGQMMGRGLHSYTSLLNLSRLSH